MGKRLIKSSKLYICDNGLVSALLNVYSLPAFEISPLLGNLWENFVFTEFIKSGFIPGKNLFFYRDQNGVEVNFILEKEGIEKIVEAKYSERPRPEKLNFRKVAPLFQTKVNCFVACNIREKEIIHLKNYSQVSGNRKGLELQQFIKQIIAFFIDGTNMAISSFDQSKKDEGYVSLPAG